MKYYEKYYGEKYVFNPIRFSPTTFQDYISVNMEFRTALMNIRYLSIVLNIN